MHEHSAPSGCTVAAAADGSAATVVFNSDTESTGCCSTGGEIVGTAQSLVKLGLSVSSKTHLATITLTGPYVLAICT